ncbi:hypothetical protein P154DRAFT_242882 [Amniculicola lignicola CBS 123094]|uniref:Uncharacterized protein n=1 Tax=Amniculicola lignicola CBS 123094 TaxID=1392246 RepID=A0A6A5WAJ9_9PLEO|nr:hypothetical protein P154DRAFT_242882 [Amniculicola lignicola CBS 123094]
MYTLRRKVSVLSLAGLLGLFFLVIYFTLQPWTADNIHAFIGQHRYTGVSVEGISPNSKTTNTTAQIIPTLNTSLQSFHKALVVAKVKAENSDWIEENFPDWKTAVYTVDDKNATLHTAQNKGHEANVYLTYIINNYSNLPDIIVFLHSHQKHKHGTRDERSFEGIDFDNVKAVKALQLEHIQKTGYANLRCLTRPGCPAEIQPFRPEAERDPLRPQENAMAKSWAELFGNDEVPQVIATPCCAQFSVSREQVLKRRKEDYEKYLKWIYDTPLDDFTSGRIFEYLWHIIFGRDPVYCPDMKQCYQDQYGTNASAVHADSNNNEGFEGG